LIFLSSSHPPPFLMTASSQNLSKFYDFEDPVNGKAFHGIQLFVKANTKQCLPYPTASLEPGNTNSREGSVRLTSSLR
jgi:hypothetical protein